mgnify:CR=1 FL=1
MPLQRRLVVPRQIRGLMQVASGLGEQLVLAGDLFFQLGQAVCFRCQGSWFHIYSFARAASVAVQFYVV